MAPTPPKGALRAGMLPAGNSQSVPAYVVITCAGANSRQEKNN
jgi:hypothetical protein